MSWQLPLSLPHHEAMEADDLMVSASNRDALAWIDQWPRWAAHCLVIYGPSASGKTHLAHVWRAKAKAKLLDASDIASQDIGVLAQGNRSLVIDNAQSLAGESGGEEQLLHLFNMSRENRGFLLLTAREAPALWGVQLPDLRSRLLASPVVELGAPDDELLSGLIIKQFRDRQIDVAAEVIDFLLPRITREPEAIRNLVAALDEASLAQNRRITIALARHILESINAS